MNKQMISLVIKFLSFLIIKYVFGAFFSRMRDMFYLWGSNSRSFSNLPSELKKILKDEMNEKRCDAPHSLNFYII